MGAALLFFGKAAKELKSQSVKVGHFARKKYKYVIAAQIVGIVLFWVQLYWLICVEDARDLRQIVILCIIVVIVLTNVLLWFETEVLWDQVRRFDDLYLCGFRVSRYIVTGSFWRFAKWAGLGLCHELSIMTMLALKHNKTATLYRGLDFTGDGQLTSHSWVEFKIPIFGWYVCDLAWTSGVNRRRCYYKMFPRRKITWQCPYDEFWGIEFSNELYDRMKNSKTSYVMGGIMMYRPIIKHDLRFHEGIYRIHMREPEKCGPQWMRPYLHGNEVCWVTTLQDFVKNSRRKQPRARSVRLANRAYKKLVRFMAELPKE